MQHIGAVYHCCVFATVFIYYFLDVFGAAESEVLSLIVKLLGICGE
jgi:hypothetical protein